VRVLPGGAAQGGGDGGRSRNKSNADENRPENAFVFFFSLFDNRGTTDYYYYYAILTYGFLFVTGVIGILCGLIACHLGKFRRRTAFVLPQLVNDL